MYHVRLALKSLRRSSILTALAMAAIALGIGAATTTVTVYRAMSGNPIEHRNDVLRAVTLDNWDPLGSFDRENPDDPPTMLTRRDAQALLESSIPTRTAAMRFSTAVLESRSVPNAAPFIALTRITTRGFFAMFEVPFRYGGGWDLAADVAAQQVAVLSRGANERAFGGENSVGRTIVLSGKEFKVVGVLNDWTPVPKFYDLSTGAFKRTEDVFLPFSTGAALNLVILNRRCWGDSAPVLEDFSEGECGYVHFWAQLDDSQQLVRFQEFIDNYAREQRVLGRFQRPLNNRLYTPAQWLARHRAVPDDQRVLVLASLAFLLVCLLNMIGVLLAKFLRTAPLVSLRRALGASRHMIFQQYLIEVGIISLGGGLLGVALSLVGLHSLQHLSQSAFYTYASTTRLDLGAGLSALAVAVACGLVAGLYPTWRICRVHPQRSVAQQRRRLPGGAADCICAGCGRQHPVSRRATDAGDLAQQRHGRSQYIFRRELGDGWPLR
jgi:putative ABC transport system permease protein